MAGGEIQGYVWLGKHVRCVGGGRGSDHEASSGEGDIKNNVKGALHLEQAAG